VKSPPRARARTDGFDDAEVAIAMQESLAPGLIRDKADFEARVEMGMSVSAFPPQAQAMKIDGGDPSSSPGRDAEPSTKKQKVGTDSFPVASARTEEGDAELEKSFAESGL
jgi:hypothetical protein